MMVDQKHEMAFGHLEMVKCHLNMGVHHREMADGSSFGVRKGSVESGISPLMSRTVHLH